MSNSFLSGKTALVTGSVSGIGLAIAQALASAGARVAVHGLATPQEAQGAVDAVKGAGAPDAKFFAGDLRDRAAIRSMLDAVEAWGKEAGGGIDILVNNAGMQKTASLVDITDQDWDNIIAINLSAAFTTMQATLPRMAERGYGRVINIASVHGLVASKQKTPYVASKFALVGISKVAALEYAQAGTRETGGVTVNCICPGWTETALIEPQIQERAALHGGDRLAGIADMLSEKQPTKRMSSPSEIGLLALWLSSPLAHNITGASIPIDGGWTAQ